MSRYLRLVLASLVLIGFAGDTYRLVASQEHREVESTTEKDNEDGTSSKKGASLASKVEHLVKEEFALDVKEAEENVGAAYNQSANSEQV